MNKQTVADSNAVRGMLEDKSMMFPGAELEAIYSTETS